MDKAITDKKRSGIPMTASEIVEYEKVWTDMEEGIDFCYKHPIKLAKKNK